MEDPNTGFKLFESGAIIEYLIKYYDKDAKFHYTKDPEALLTQSWLHFQMSGQGPYFGQLAWFAMFHQEV
jgi:glutathione S-transferase